MGVKISISFWGARKEVSDPRGSGHGSYNGIGPGPIRSLGPWKVWTRRCSPTRPARSWSMSTSRHEVRTCIYAKHFQVFLLCNSPLSVRALCTVYSHVCLYVWCTVYSVQYSKKKVTGNRAAQTSGISIGPIGSKDPRRPKVSPRRGLAAVHSLGCIASGRSKTNGLARLRIHAAVGIVHQKRRRSRAAFDAWKYDPKGNRGELRKRDLRKVRQLFDRWPLIHRWLA